MTDTEIEQLARWLSSNHERPLLEIMDAIATTWPDATAEEIKRAMQRMNEIAKDRLNRQSTPIERRSRFRLVGSDSHGEPA
ncbi:MAG: hypothetical protein P8Z76_18730 [Alphaproteobacteria bacterium]